MYFTKAPTSTPAKHASLRVRAWRTVGGSLTKCDGIRETSDLLGYVMLSRVKLSCGVAQS